jgi:hypothetical protein
MYLLIKVIWGAEKVYTEDTPNQINKKGSFEIIHCHRHKTNNSHNILFIFKLLSLFTLFSYT